MQFFDQWPSKHVPRTLISCGVQFWLFKFGAVDLTGVYPVPFLGFSFYKLLSDFVQRVSQQQQQQQE